MTLQQILDECQAMTWSGLNQASDKVLEWLTTMSEHPMTDAAYQILLRRRQAMEKPKPFIPWADEMKAMKPKRRGK